MSDLDDIAQDLGLAANTGAEGAGHAAVMAGAHHLNSGAHELLRVENIVTSMQGELSASVQASQPAGVGPGPMLGGSEGTADVMAEAAISKAIKEVMGQK